MNAAYESNDINIWVSFADVFAGLLLIAIIGLAVILPRQKDVRFSQELVSAMNQATKTTQLIQSRLEERLPAHSEKPTYSETEIIIPSAALFKSFGFDDFLHDQEKGEVLAAICEAIHSALVESGDQRRFLRVVIEGHTDNVPISEAAATPAIKTNWELSSRRATGVLRFFENAGLSPREFNIVAMGLADSTPVADNSSDEGRAKNRRIVIRIEPDLETIKANLAPGH
jgi:outer membrane protein OmpA-like peptidoglycan-associated protein